MSDHLRERLFPGEDNTEELFIEDNTLRKHPILNIKFTSYEVQREDDIVHIGYDQTGISVYTPTLEEDENEPWSYATVLAVFHLTVRTVSKPEPQTITVLWVRWMERNATGLAGPNSQNYTRVSFVPWTGTPGGAFDFVDPSHVIRACHLIPAFSLGRTHELLDPSIARDPKGDWCAFYANRYSQNWYSLLAAAPTDLIRFMTYGPTTSFVDWDAFARFAGIGIGCQRFQAPRALNIQVGPDCATNCQGLQGGEEDSLTHDELDEGMDEI